MEEWDRLLSDPFLPSLSQKKGPVVSVLCLSYCRNQDSSLKDVKGFVIVQKKVFESLTGHMKWSKIDT